MVIGSKSVEKPERRHIELDRWLIETDVSSLFNQRQKSETESEYRENYTIVVRYQIYMKKVLSYADSC